MRKGYLSEYFVGVGVKHLSAVEADVLRSNQHEFNGVETFRTILGEPDGKVRFSAKFLYLNDHDDDPVVDEGFMTWYDARQKARVERNVMRWEYRLYFPTNQVSQIAAEGDLLVIARRTDNTLLAVVAERGSTIERQLLWLFGFTDVEHPGFSVKAELETEQDRIGFAARVILEGIGVEPEEQAPNFLDAMLGRFGGQFPRTVDFSAYARSTLPDLTANDDPDAALVAWMGREEILFRTLERHLLAERLQAFQQAREPDPDEYMKLALSFMQRRKARAGSALENHLETIFAAHFVSYTRTGVTEKALRPDFIFPGIDRYHSSQFPDTRLTMLAAKTTCKDRWRQILNEAERIRVKHLLTLEPAITEGQTAEMQGEDVQLVLPQTLHETYTENQRRWLMGVRDFVELVRERQERN